MAILNIHERILPVPITDTGQILESLAGPNDLFWHSDMVEPIVLDNGLAVGSRGGHGPVRYTVVTHVPGTFVRFRFDPGIGLAGHHQLEVLPGPDARDMSRSILRHTISARAVGSARVLWPLLIRAIHDGALEDMLDHVERSLTGHAHRQQRTPRWVRAVAYRIRQDKP